MNEIWRRDLEALTPTRLAGKLWRVHSPDMPALPAQR
jgi:hypothetical protein